ncbi:MAG: Membrane fusion protein multidrug efflux system [Bradyrhizobium sp.]|jgi:hypothetical protein|nr:Membrane fusion protein multidrug efflux system [Bradyrhizobium sp.]
MASPWHRLVNPHYDLFSLLQEAGLIVRHGAMRNSGLETISNAAEPSVARRTPSHSPEADREKRDSTDVPGGQSAPAGPRSRWRQPLLAASRTGSRCVLA